MSLFVLRSPVQRYAWGSRTAIPALVGDAPIPENEPPIAELWMGAHPSAPSRIERANGDAVGLDQLIEADPAVLGARVQRAFGDRLPFLFKVLAADRPLSIQCHPDAAAARAGFDRENRLGIPLAARERSYRDPSHKPELLVALGRFQAMVGFRSPREIRQRLAAAGADELAGALAAIEGPGGLAGFLASVLRLGPDARAAMLARVDRALSDEQGREAGWVRRLRREHPDDAAALSPLFLNLVELSADQGIYLDAGVLHAYLEGVGLEVMASSDNVLRGGLTDKHVDVDELGRILHPAATTPSILEPVADDARLRVYATPAAEFRLGFVDLDRGPYERRRAESAGPEIVLALAGQCHLTDPRSGDHVALRRGEAAFLGADAPSFRLEGEAGRAYLAFVP